MGDWTFGLLVLLGIVMAWAFIMYRIAKREGVYE